MKTDSMPAVIRTTTKRWRWVPMLLGLAACDPPTPAHTAPSASSAPAAVSSGAETKLASAKPSASASPERPGSKFALSTAEFSQLSKELSEPDAEFFSDNFVSNETSYLQVTDALEARPKGGAYIGVGPEQNFTYIGLTQPDVAYIVDIRRDNLVLQMLYKAAFHEATSRAHFLSLLTGREHDTAGEPGKRAALAEVFAHVDKTKATTASYAAVHGLLSKVIAEEFHVTLTAKDKRNLDRAHRAFFKQGLDLRFTLKEASFRKYPSLRELAVQKSPKGIQAGFLADESRFRYVQQMQRENRIIPVVGDFAGNDAVPALAAHMKKTKQTLRSFYVSNVEQYLMHDGKWWKWQRNIAAFPTDDDSIFIRCYLNQGKKHPQEMDGHRTTTTLHRIADFNARKKPYPSMLALASDGVLASK